MEHLIARPSTIRKAIEAIDESRKMRILHDIPNIDQINDRCRKKLVRLLERGS